MGLAQVVRTRLRVSNFGPPCPELTLQRAEQALGEPLTAPLRELYSAFDGFVHSPGGNFLWPLFGQLSLVETNQLYRGGFLYRGGPKKAPAFLRRLVFFGDNGCADQWAIRLDPPGGVVQWNNRWPNDLREVGDGPLEAWMAVQRRYDEMDAEEA